MPPTVLTGAGNETFSQSSGATPVACAKPSNVANGDLLIAEVVFQTAMGAADTITAPSGWTLASAPSYQDVTKRVTAFYYKYIASAAAETATTYTWTCTTTGRTVFRIKRVTGASPTAPINAFGAQSTSPKTGPIVIPGLTTTVDDCVALILEHSTSTSTQIPITVGTPTGWTAYTASTGNGGSGSQETIWSFSLAVPTAGAVGSATSSLTPAQTDFNGVMIAIAPASTSRSASVTMASTSALSVGPSQQSSGSVAMASASTLQISPVITPYDNFLILPRASRNVAHRGCEADLPEMTMYAFDQVVAYSKTAALNVDGFVSSDGKIVASHNQSTLEVTGVDLDIPSTTWATLQTLRTLNGNQPMCLVKDVLDKYGASRVIFIENKQGSGVQTAFNTLLASYPTATKNFVWKSSYGGVSKLTSAKAANAVAGGWGYWFPADSAAITQTNVDAWDILGLEYDASSADWAAMRSFAGSKKILAHVIQTVANATQANASGADGLMTAKMYGVIPNDIPQDSATATMASTSTLVVSPQGSGSASVTMASTSTVSVSGTDRVNVSVTMASTSAVTVSASDQIGSSVTMASVSTLAAGTQRVISAAVNMDSSSTLTVLTQGSNQASVTMASTSTLSVSGTGQTGSTVTMASSSTLAVGTQRVIPVSVTMASASALTISTSGGSSTSVAMASTSTLALGTSFIRSTAVVFASTSALSLTAVASKSSAVSMTSTSTLSVQSSQSQAASVSMTSVSTLTVTPEVPRVTDISLMSTSTLAIVAFVSVLAPIVMESTSTLSAGPASTDYSVFQYVGGVWKRVHVFRYRNGAWVPQVRF